MSIKEKIHPSTVIASGAKIGKNVTIGPYAVIGENVVLCDDVVIQGHVTIVGNTTIGEGTIVFPYASIGAPPQAVRYKGEFTEVIVGKQCQIREFVTINSSVGEGTRVEIGNNCFIMAYCHIAHNSILGDHVVMSNNATLAGHVTLEHHAIIGGMTPIHQFVRVGAYAMVGGLSRVTHDIPPYTIGAGIPWKFGGLNLVGLKRNGFTLEIRSELSKAFRLLYRSQLHPEEALARIEKELHPYPEVLHWLDFCKNSKRGLIGLQGVHSSCDQEFSMLEDE